jgi:site-specific DNA-adenine methylase
MTTNAITPLRPFFLYYGGKWRAAPRYPKPQHTNIVEPFAGAAGYSLRHHSHEITLYDADPVVAGIWRWLIDATPDDVRALPLIAPGQDLHTLPVEGSARDLIGFWLNKGSTQPKRTLSAWAAECPNQFWGEKIRERIARQVESIKHWKVINRSYLTAPNVEASWFVDPPYQQAGKYYRHGANRLDFSQLGEWCRSRRGQVLVCENAGADWLDFRPWRNIKARKGQSAEVLWTNTQGANQ